MRSRLRAVALTAAVALVGLYDGHNVAAGAASRPRRQAKVPEGIQAEVFSWFVAHADLVMDAAFLPVTSPAEERLQRKWRATLRFLDFETPELHISISRGRDDSVEATIIQGEKAFGDQLIGLKSDRPSARLEDLAKDLRTRRFKLRQDGCAPLAALAADLEALEIGAVPQNVLVLHATNYSLWVENHYGDMITARLSGSGSPADVDDPAIVHWMEKVRKALLEDCRATKWEPSDRGANGASNSRTSG